MIRVNLNIELLIAVSLLHAPDIGALEVLRLISFLVMKELLIQFLSVFDPREPLLEGFSLGGLFYDVCTITTTTAS